MPPSSVEHRIFEAARRLFAERGFDTSLAEIGRAARVSPETLRRCVKGKRQLQERVIKDLFGGRWKAEWDALLRDRRLPLERRLVRFYSEYRGNIDRTGARLWARAGLMGLHASGNFSATLEERILKPLVRELRHAAGLRGREARAVSKREIELAQMLHGAIAFPHQRSHVYGMRVYGRLPELADLMVRVWLPGAKAEIRRLAATH
jgi:AcrR family transcriptional regulator